MRATCGRGDHPRWDLQSVAALPAEDKAPIKQAFRRRGAFPGVVGCVDASLIAPKGDRKTWFMSPEGYYALNVISAIQT